ncbi:hypothetical protein F0562_034387 [Nyssa sinensis]|uniref:Uncharacterized protein n=1 Tax=Nyssa sinensis TaxID=561372 RepID=A0A5J5AHY9_9ASTE|nr:hypothetical protein F0562_034387 [Nyssa sinensis]
MYERNYNNIIPCMFEYPSHTRVSCAQVRYFSPNNEVENGWLTKRERLMFDSGDGGFERVDEGVVTDGVGEALVEAEWWCSLRWRRTVVVVVVEADSVVAPVVGGLAAVV